MKRFIWRALRAAGIGYAAVVLLMYLFQRRLQYFPDPTTPSIPGGDRFRGIEEVELSAGDGVRLRAWYWPGTLPVDLLVLHGNAGHRGNRLEWIADLRSTGPGVLIVDYRGYGGSDGSPTEKGLYLDADAGLAWLEARAPGHKVVYLGESLGGAVAVDLAARRAPAALVLQSTFASAVDVAAAAYSFVPVRLLMKDRFENLPKIAAVRCPVLVIHGAADSLVPPAFARRLFEAANEPKTWLEVPGADHNDLPWVGGKAYLEQIGKLVRGL